MQEYLIIVEIIQHVDNLQNRIEYNEMMERQRREQEEKKRKCIQDIKLDLAKLFEEGKEEKKDEEKKENLMEEHKVKRKKNKLHKRQKMIYLNIDQIFEEKFEKK